jgi:hypothetical protein
MPELTEYQALLAKRKAETVEHVHEQRTHLVPRVREITHKAQMVVDHPGYQWFLDMLETRIKEVDVVLSAKRERMWHGAEMGQDLERLKIELNAMDAEVRALKYAQSLIPTAIETGNKVIAGVNSQAAAGSVAN